MFKVSFFASHRNRGLSLITSAYYLLTFYIAYAIHALMSYTSESKLPKGATLTQAQELIDLLGYKRWNNNLKVPNHVGGYFWYDENDYRSYTGVGLDLYRKTDGQLIVTTRSSAGRSH